jgi:hypothetical protein
MALTLTQLRQKVTDNLADFSNIVPEKVREVDNEIINFLEDLSNKSLPIKVGYISGLNIGAGITGFGGNIIAAVHTAGTNGSSIESTLDSAIVGNYKVQFDIESKGSTPSDDDLSYPVFRVISATQFEISITEPGNSDQNVTLHMEIKKINY